MTIFFSLVIGFAGIWAYFPGGFGLRQYKASHGKAMGIIASVTYWLLVIIHPLALYNLWFGRSAFYGWVVAVVLAHVIYFTIFARGAGPDREVKRRS